jgi:4-hydroxybenzoate polyprenyltransferase
VDVDPTALPVCEGFLEFVRDQQRSGRQVLLVTASDQKLAERVAKHLGLFCQVLGSDGRTNLRGGAKGQRLVQLFGERGFDYAGNCTMDLPVWQLAREALVVNATTGVLRQARGCSRVTGVFDPGKPCWKCLLRAIRPHQWVKNLILLVPLLTAHKLIDPALVGNALLAFVAFCLCASGVYLLNDIFDLDADRQHPTRRLRPLATGDLPVSYGLVAAPLLVLAGVGTAAMITWSFAAVLVGYLALTTGYSLRLKEVVLLDVFCLASLYTLRLIGGHEATGVAYSSWLLVFSMFIFLSLALVKRFVEVKAARSRQDSQVRGRGYTAGDLELVSTLGASSGFLAVLVLALYVNSQEVRVLYSHPTLLLLVCPLMLYWISRVWLMAHREMVHDDPVVFALRDRTSYGVGLLILLIVWLATGHP